jgi:hypothetical protein
MFFNASPSYAFGKFFLWQENSFIYNEIGGKLDSVNGN